jgi:hypothetical protein
LCINVNNDISDLLREIGMIDITNIINLPTKVGETLTLKPADCTNKFYHSLNNWIGSSTWKDWAAKTAKEAKFGKRNLSNNIEIQIGSAFHLLLEDEEQFNNDIFFTNADGRSSEYKEIKNNLEDGQLIFKLNIKNMLYAMRDSLFSHKLSDTYLHHESSKKEWSYFIYDKDFKQKIRCDLSRVGIKDPNKDIIVDYKTAASVDPRKFARSVKDFGYHIQVAHYVDVYEKVTGRQVEDFVFACVEKKEPYLTAFYTLNKQTLAEGKAALIEAKRKYTFCHDMNDFGGYPEILTEIGLSKWDLEFTNSVDNN